MNVTKIEYLDFTWSPLVGCSQIGCAVKTKCWAKYQAKRRKRKCQLCYEFKPHTHFERLIQPLYRKKPAKIGVCYSADFWDKWFSDYERTQVLGVVDSVPRHYFINLTKQTQNIPFGQWFPKNWIQGASVCRTKDLIRVTDLWKLQTKTLLSIEPLYEDLPNLDLRGLDWVIIGAQTHPLKLPKKEWVYKIISKARTNNVPIFIKNNLSKLGYNIQEYPGYNNIREYPSFLLASLE